MTIHHRIFNPSFLFASLSLALLVLAGCGGSAPDPSTIYQQISDGSLSAGDQIPSPSDDTILTITGLIGTENIDGKIEMDRETIESVGLVDYTVTDPLENTEITFRGVLMSDLLDLWQVDSNATSLDVTALNDYQVMVPLKDMYDFPVFFALMADGEYMDAAYRGPAMLVYPYDDLKFDSTTYNNYWVWQIKSIDVR